MRPGGESGSNDQASTSADFYKAQLIEQGWRRLSRERRNGFVITLYSFSNLGGQPGMGALVLQQRVPGLLQAFFSK